MVLSSNLIFKMLKISSVGPHLLKGSLWIVKIMIKCLNSPFSNSLSFWDNHYLSKLKYQTIKSVLMVQVGINKQQEK